MKNQEITYTLHNWHYEKEVEEVFGQTGDEISLARLMPYLTPNSGFSLMFLNNLGTVCISTRQFGQR